MVTHMPYRFFISSAVRSYTNRIFLKIKIVITHWILKNLSVRCVYFVQCESGRMELMQTLLTEYISCQQHGKWITEYIYLIYIIYSRTHVLVFDFTVTMFRPLCPSSPFFCISIYITFSDYPYLGISCQG